MAARPIVFGPSSTVSGYLFWDDQVLERLGGRIEAPLIQKCSANYSASYRFGIAFYQGIWLLGVDPSSHHVFSGQARRFLSLPADRP